MKTRKNYIFNITKLITILVFLGTFFITSQVLATTLIVNDISDDSDTYPGDSICVTSSGVCSLRAAIEEANALPGTDTILIKLSATIVITSPIEITDSFELIGKGAQKTLISSLFTNPNFYDVFQFISGSISISDVGFTGHSYILFNTHPNTQLDLSNVDLTSNNASGAIPLIYSLGTTNIEDAVFSHNTMGSYLIETTSQLTITRSTFIKNSSSVNTASMIITANVGQTEITRSSFHSNYFANGSMIKVEDGALVKVGYSTFAGNTVASSNTSIGRTSLFNALGLYSRIIISNTTIVENVFNLQSVAINTWHVFSSILLSNSILAENTVKSGSLCNFRSGSVIASAGHNIIDSAVCSINFDSTDIASPSVVAGLGNFSYNGNPGNGHFPLLTSSPAINSAVNQVCHIYVLSDGDQINQPLLNPNLCDIGAIQH